MQKTTTLWLSRSECAVIDYKLGNSIIVIGVIRSPGQFTFRSLTTVLELALYLNRRFSNTVIIENLLVGQTYIE